MTFLFGVLAVIVVVAILLIGLYNGLIKLRNRVDESWSDIKVQLKRRHDLIPNLMNTVKGYAKHEQGVFEEVTKARSQAMQAGTMEDQLVKENQLTGALKSLFAVAENYPDLKANQNFLELQTELTNTEDKIQASRRFYNGNVRDFNTKLQVFPTNIIGRMLGFKDYAFFETSKDEEKNPEVKF